MASTAAGTTATIASISLAGGLLGIVAIISLLIVVLMKETGVGGSRAERSSPSTQFLLRTLNAPILALLPVFVAIVIDRVLDILS